MFWSVPVGRPPLAEGSSGSGKGTSAQWCAVLPFHPVVRANMALVHGRLDITGKETNELGGSEHWGESFDDWADAPLPSDA